MTVKKRKRKLTKEDGFLKRIKTEGREFSFTAEEFHKEMGIYADKLNAMMLAAMEGDTPSIFKQLLALDSFSGGVDAFMEAHPEETVKKVKKLYEGWKKLSITTSMVNPVKDKARWDELKREYGYQEVGEDM